MMFQVEMRAITLPWNSGKKIGLKRSGDVASSVSTFSISIHFWLAHRNRENVINSRSLLDSPSFVVIPRELMDAAQRRDDKKSNASTGESRTWKYERNKKLALRAYEASTPLRFSHFSQLTEPRSISRYFFPLVSIIGECTLEREPVQTMQRVRDTSTWTCLVLRWGSRFSFCFSFLDKNAIRLSNVGSNSRCSCQPLFFLQTRLILLREARQDSCFLASLPVGLHVRAGYFPREPYERITKSTFSYFPSFFLSRCSFSCECVIASSETHRVM